HPKRHRAARGAPSNARDALALDGRAVVQSEPGLSTRSPAAAEGTIGRQRRVGGPAAMTAQQAYDAVVVGAGPNGMAAAIVLARAGLRVLLREGADEPGGGARTDALTLPGFMHDVCSAVHPLGIGSP